MYPYVHYSFIHIFFIHLSVEGHLGCFHFGAVVSNVIVNMGVQRSVCMCIFNSFGYIPRSRITESYGSMFNYIRNYHTIFHYGYIISTFPLTVHNGSNFSIFSSTIILYFVFNSRILISMKWIL